MQPTGHAGFSTVEVLLAATIFGFLITGLVGAFIYGREATDNAGVRNRAIQLAEEATEAVRNIRDGAYSNLTDGTYGLAQSANQWTLSGSQDTSDIFTRQVTIAANGTNRKTVTSQVSWTSRGVTRQLSIATQLTNWVAALVKSWATPTMATGLDLTGTNTGVKVAAQGNYAYVVRTDGTPDFVIVDISVPTVPTVVGSLSLTGSPTNVFVSGNYAYVSGTGDTSELMVINVTTPTTPTLTGTYDAPGTGDGRGIYVVGNSAYLVRAANGGNNEFVIVNVAVPATPTRISGYNLNVNMNEVYVSGTAAFVATSSDTQEVLVINTIIPTILALGTAVNLPGTTDATTIDGYGSTLVVGQGTSLVTISFLTPLIPVIGGSVTLSGVINDVTVSSSLNLAFAGTADTAKPFQVINTANTAAPSLYGSTSVTGSPALSGVAYSTSKDRVVGVGSLTTQEVEIFAPN